MNPKWLTTSLPLVVDSAAPHWRDQMAEKGARVLVIERETHFKDRIRGEYLPVGRDRTARARNQ
jgi:hypothetical protein